MVRAIVFGFTRSCRELLFESAIYHVQGKHTNIYTADVMDSTLTPIPAW
jgi:hypothetical protein